MIRNLDSLGKVGGGGGVLMSPSDVHTYYKIYTPASKLTRGKLYKESDLGKHL
jgi:hypothetical protein